jgi:hypothetical protein
VRGVTTQRTSWALAREAAGLLLTAFGLLGVLVALSTLHWAAGASVGLTGLLVVGLRTRPKPGSPRWARTSSVVTCITAYAGLTACAFSVLTPLGWIGVSLAVVLAGLWLTSRDAVEEGEGA